MRLLLVALLLVAVAAPAPAAAAAAELPAGPLVYREGGPVLTSGGAMWVERSSERLTTVVGAPFAGGLQRLLRPEYAEISADGGPATVVTRRHVWAGTPTGGLRQVYEAPLGCATVTAEAGVDLLAVAIACDGGWRIVVIRPGRPQRTFPSADAFVEAAGHHVAWSAAEDDDAVVLYDAEADREALRVGGAGGPRVYAVELQADGKLLLGVPGRRSAWISPAEPVLHELDLYPGPVRAFVGDRVLALDLGLELRLHGLDGSRRVLARLRSPARINGAHFDGRRVVFARATCDGNRVVVRPASAPVLTLRERALCRLRLTRSFLVRFERDRPTIFGGVRCVHTTLRRCGELVARTADGRKLGSGTGSRRGLFSVSLTDGGVRRIAREGRMRVRLEMHEEYRRSSLQRPTHTTLRVGPRTLRRLRRCVAARRHPSLFACPR